MGLLTKLLAAPVSGPFRGAMWTLMTIARRAEAELYDEGGIRREITELELRYDLGEIDDEQYDRIEQALMERLRESRKRNAAR